MLGVFFFKEEIFQLTNTFPSFAADVFFSAGDKMEMKHGSMSGFFLSFVWIWVKLKLMKYCDRGCEKNNIKILVGDCIFVSLGFFFAVDYSVNWTVGAALSRQV